jgi:hypothetical protein
VPKQTHKKGQKRRKKKQLMVVEDRNVPQDHIPPFAALTLIILFLEMLKFFPLKYFFFPKEQRKFWEGN